MTPLVRRLLVGLIPPATVCVLTGVWVLDQAALAVRLLREQRRLTAPADPSLRASRKALP